MTARLRRAALVAACLLAVPVAAAASGAWRTLQRPFTFGDLLFEGDTLWCATGEAGLLVYHASTGAFETIAREPSGLASNRLSSLALDATGHLWVGTRGEGVSVLGVDRTTWSVVNAFDGLPSDTVNTLSAQGDSMWIGTARGLAVWDGRQISGILPDGVNASPFPSDVIRGIVERGDSLWVATAAGVRVGRLSEGLSTWTRADSGLATTSVIRLVTDGAALFALDGVVVHRWDDAAHVWVLFGGIGAVRSLSADRGVVLAGAGNGIVRWNGAGWTVVDATLRAGAASPLEPTVDAQGRLYVAGQPLSAADARGIGLYRQPDGAGAWTFALPPGPPSNDCLNLDLDGDRLYVTTYAGGIGRLSPLGWTLWVPGAVGDTTSTAFRRPVYNFGELVDRHGLKWFSSWAPLAFAPSGCVPDTGSVDVLDDTGAVDRIEHFVLGPAPSDARRSFIRASTLDSTGGHWFGLDSPCGDEADLAAAGLEYYRPDGSYGGNYGNAAGTLTGVPNNQVYSLVTDSRGRMWIGTAAGLYFVSSASAGSPPATLVPTPVPGTSASVIRGLAAYGDSLWSYSAGGVERYTIAGNFPIDEGSYNVPGNPAFNAVRPMDVGRDGTLWLATSSGVRAYHPGNTVTDYTTANSPLADDEVRTIRVDRRTGAVWIATAGGVSRFDPGYVPPASVLASLTTSVYPNPARLSAIGVSIRLAGNGTTYQGTVYDLGGRVVHRFESHANGRVVWDGHDDRGHLVGPGIYFVRAESGGRSAVTRLVLLR